MAEVISLVAVRLLATPIYSGPLMIDVIGPAPGDQDVDVQQVIHGKSDSRSRTASVVRGG
jgi:hypothetical protein